MVGNDDYESTFAKYRIKLEIHTLIATCNEKKIGSADKLNKFLQK